MGRIKRKIPPWFRFLIHIVAACLSLWVSGIAEYEFIISNYVFVLPNWILYLAFAFWSVLVINAVNWIDGVYAQGNGILAI
jgi:UDP-N-acetylmuramyl pentapeptide phosphotransferase/UDP-N-acetylglucosamine-1-phosphate transferase